jgi:hypothetical protein
MSDNINYWRVKAKCTNCALHFVICTFRPDTHSAASLFCPECGQHRGQFLVWREPVQNECIFNEVPGNHTISDVVQLSARPTPWWRFWKTS